MISCAHVAAVSHNWFTHRRRQLAKGIWAQSARHRQTVETCRRPSWMWPLLTRVWLDWAGLFLDATRFVNHSLVYYQQSKKFPITDKLLVHSDTRKGGISDKKHSELLTVHLRSVIQHRSRCFHVCFKNCKSGFTIKSIKTLICVWASLNSASTR